MYSFDILLGRVYKKIPEATYTCIYCTSVKDYLLNLLGNIEVVDLIAPHVAQLTTLLSELACNVWARSLVVSDLHSETKGAWFESGC